MKTWFVSRHPGAVQWLAAQDLMVDQLVAHLDPEQIAAGDRVIGTLPIHLAAEVCSRRAEYWHLTMDVPSALRGQELSYEQMQELNVHLQRFLVLPLVRAESTSL